MAPKDSSEQNEAPTVTETAGEAPTGPGKFVTEAYNLENEESMKLFYARWAREYDQQMVEGLNYVSPGLIAGKMMERLDDRDAKILDLGCGTGLTVYPLAEQGFTNLYGIDLSREMVEVANRKGLYKGLQVGDVNLPLEYESDSLDGVISSGTFTHGHVGPGPLDEICRILKPGGILACTVHKDLWQSMGFADRFKQLENQSRLRCLSLEMGPYYENNQPEGWFCVYRKESIKISV